MGLWWTEAQQNANNSMPMPLALTYWPDILAFARKIILGKIVTYVGGRDLKVILIELNV
jgi:hypothetical protein